MNRESFRYIVRVAAGVYVAYLGYKILKGGVIGGEMTGKSWILGLVFSILFIVVGAFLTVVALRGMSRAKELAEEEEQEEEQEAPAEIPQAAPGERSLFDRAGVSVEDGDADGEDAEADETDLS